jgi:hypothetical protein
VADKALQKQREKEIRGEETWRCHLPRTTGIQLGTNNQVENKSTESPNAETEKQKFQKKHEVPQIQYIDRREKCEEKDHPEV